MSSVVAKSKPKHLNLWREVLVALLVGSILLVNQAWIDDRRSEREIKTAQVMADEADRRENLRFVRERSSEQATDRPFTNMDLVEQNLASLDMAQADFENAKLMRAFMPGVNLESANLRTTGLSEAYLGRANLLNADLRGADLRGTVLSDAKLDGAVLEASCHDDKTQWPDGFVPPASANEICNVHDQATGKK